MTGPHAAYADRLALLAEPAALAPYLDAWAIAHGFDRPLAWDREYGRFRPGGTPWAELVLVGTAEQTDERCTVRVAVLDDARPTSEVGATRHAGSACGGLWYDERLRWMALSGPADDPGLPGLADVLAALDLSQIVRYRPGARCTLRGSLDGTPCFVKIAPDGARLSADATELWRVGSTGALGFDVAAPLGWDEPTSAVWYGVVAGHSIVDDLLGPRGARVAARIGAALGTLAQAPLHPTRVEGPEGQLDRTRRAARRVTRTAPGLAARLDASLRRLEGLHTQLVERDLVPVHGAPHMHQWLDDAGRLGLIDFDRFALGEPELDLATFLAELDTESDRQLPMVELEAAVVTGFESTGPGLDPYRLALYRAHKRVAKVARTACALRPDGLSRAQDHLRSVDGCLDDLEASLRAVA